MKTFLKIKIKSIAEEARMIRKEELKYKRGNHPLRQELRLHRLGLRPGQRETYLAYAFLRNRPYRALEASPRTNPNWRRVYKMVEKYGAPYFTGRNVTIKEAFEDWKDGPSET